MYNKSGKKLTGKKRRPRRLLNVLCTFNLRPVSARVDRQFFEDVLCVT